MTLTISPDVERVLRPREETEQDGEQAEAEHDHGEVTAGRHLALRLVFILTRIM